MLFKYIHDPMLYQGRKKGNHYFEGWFFKQVTPDEKTTICIIPGISKDEKNSHAFIQTIIHRKMNSGISYETHYHRFPTKDLQYTEEPFCLKIGRNIFKKEGLELHLKDEHYSLTGLLYFLRFTPIKINLLYPNIMGYFAYLPFMECYHGVISMNHQLKGKLVLNKETISFNLGKGYIEKDWGTSFPKEYIWLQSNHFSHSDASIMLSIAHIPFLGTSFQGMICNLTFHGFEYRFATYNHSKVVKLERNEENLNIIITKRDLKLQIKAKMHDGGLLKAPKFGNMNHVIKEGLNGILKIKLTKSDEILFQGVSKSCGIEMVDFNQYRR